jgi:hypothetical protein
MPRLRDDEKGIGRVLIIGIIVVVIAIVAVVIWQTTKKSSTTSSVSTTSTSAKTTTSPAISSACLKSYNDNSLCAFANHTNIASQQYTANGTATSGTDVTSTYTVQNDGKGNTEVSYSSNGKQISAITLDGSTYLQTGANTTWLEYSGSSLGSATTVPNPTSGFNLNFTKSTPAGVTVTKDGTATCGNLECYKYKVVNASTPTTTEYVYFDTNDYLLRQWTSNDTSSGVLVNLTFSYLPVTITKPSPVQQIST